MSVKRITSYTCDMCGNELPEEYKNTDGEGGSYFIWDVYNEVHLKEPIKECNKARVKVTLGGKDDRRYTDLCNACKLKVLRQAIEYYESLGLDKDTEEEQTDDNIPGQLTIEDVQEGGSNNAGKEANV